jgi:hypothetical protein
VALTTTVTIQLKECYTITDMVASNLQTVHNDDILQTQGMIYITAITPDGKSVHIDKTKPIRIQMPVYPYIPGTKIFTGGRDENGNMNWVTVEEIDKKLVPLPIKTIDPDNDFGFTQDPAILNNAHMRTHHTLDDIRKYENTLLATHEFKVRYYRYPSPRMTQIYIDNLDKNMWEVDELAVQYLLKDSAERVNKEINAAIPWRKGGDVTEEEQREAQRHLIQSAKEFGREKLVGFRMFAAQKLTKIDTTIKVDPTKAQEFVEAIMVSYSLSEFGWINCDAFYNDPKAEPIKLIVQTSKPPSVINLVFKKKRVILSGIIHDRNKFRFTRDEEKYSKLPKGDTATVLAIGYHEDQIIFGSKEIVIGQQEVEDLDLHVITAAELKKRLASYGR